MQRRHFLAGALVPAALGASSGLKVGCQTRSYMAPNRDRAKLTGMLDDIAAAGYTGVETNYISVEESFANPAPMRGELAGRGLSLIGLHMGIPWEKAELMDAALDTFHRVVKGTSALGGTHVILSGQAGGEALKRKCEMLPKMAATCREQGIHLAIHNHTEEALDNWREFRYILANTGPDVGLLLDAGHAIMARQDPWAFLREFPGRTAGLHLRDRTPEKPVLMGKGHLNLKGLGQAIRESKWKGWLIVELEGYPLDGVSGAEGVREARRMIRAHTGA
ncbi:MAG: sugar phosphate isomerase/epimerase [Bryobacteraceae bacterium]|nr:sugar phosphate isomerase/epimerase [Bryobacteraceae bacterium]